MSNQVETNEVPMGEPAAMPPPLSASGVSKVVEEPAQVPEVAEERTEDIIDKIVPQTDPVDVTLEYNGQTKTYTQKTLKYFRKIQFFSLVGTTINEIMEGPDGVNIDAIFGDGSPTSVDDFRTSDLGELGTFVNAIAQVAGHAPEFLKKCYLIWLNVPEDEKPWAELALEEIDDDLGEQIIITFIDQNYKALEDFFTKRPQKVAERIQNLRK